MLPIVENKFPHYYPNSFSGPEPDKSQVELIPRRSGDDKCGRLVPTKTTDEDTDFFKQPRTYSFTTTDFILTLAMLV